VSTVPPSPLPLIRREILVDTDPATAFAVFTDRIGQWWPLEAERTAASRADSSRSPCARGRSRRSLPR
jgi:hypothetical protein